MSVYNYSHPTYEQAAQSLMRDGFKRRGSEAYGEVFTIPSVVDDWYGGYRKVAIAYIQHNHVDPVYNEPDYFTVEFL